MRTVADWDLLECDSVPRTRVATQSCSCHQPEWSMEPSVVGIPVCWNCGTVSTWTYMDKKPKNKYRDGPDPGDECIDVFIDPLLPKSSFALLIAAGGGADMIALRKLQSNYIPVDERLFVRTIETLHNRCASTGIPESLLREASLLFKQLQENQGRVDHDTTRGTMRRSLLAAVLLYTCQAHHLWKTPAAVAECFDLTEAEMSKGRARLAAIAKHRHVPLPCDMMQVPDVVARLLDEEGFSGPARTQAMELGQWVHAQRVCLAHSPLSVAAGVLLLSCPERDMIWLQRAGVSWDTANRMMCEISTARQVQPELGKRRREPTAGIKKRKIHERFAIPSL